MDRGDAHATGIAIPVPGSPLLIRTVVLDLNGTLARDGHVLPGVREAVGRLTAAARVLLVSGDTFGTADDAARALGIAHVRIGADGQGEAKRGVVASAGADATCMVGNGRNDALALGAAALGICVCGPEGCAVEALLAADVVVASAADALDLLANPTRLVATLRT